MNFFKSKYRFSLSDDSIVEALRLTITKVNVDIDKIVKDKLIKNEQIYEWNPLLLNLFLIIKSICFCSLCKNFYCPGNISICTALVNFMSKILHIICHT